MQQAREVVGMSRRELAKRVGIDPRYLANIELCGTIPSVPVVMQLIRLCKLPAERYFNPGLIREDSKQRQRTSHKLQLCPENTCQPRKLYHQPQNLFFPIQFPLTKCQRVSYNARLVRLQKG